MDGRDFGGGAAVGRAQGIEAVSFFAAGKKDTSGKPGPAVRPDAPKFLKKIFVRGRYQKRGICAIMDAEGLCQRKMFPFLRFLGR
jgi:hypothetical protein